MKYNTGNVLLSFKEWSLNKIYTPVYVRHRVLIKGSRLLSGKKNSNEILCNNHQSLRFLEIIIPGFAKTQSFKTDIQV